MVTLDHQGQYLPRLSVVELIRWCGLQSDPKNAKQQISNPFWANKGAAEATPLSFLKVHVNDDVSTVVWFSRLPMQECFGFS